MGSYPGDKHMACRRVDTAIDAMKIYTRTGDRGMTSLFSGERVSKAHPRVRAYGSVDELNSQLGLARSLQPAAEVDAILRELQLVLFTLGADLATTASSKPVPRIEADDVARLESQIDHMQAALPQLRHFILPGGSPCASVLHVARGLCRRAEREILELPEGDVRAETLAFINRLSDHLFVLSRYQNFLSGAEEEKWVPRESKS